MWSSPGQKVSQHPQRASVLLQWMHKIEAVIPGHLIQSEGPWGLARGGSLCPRALAVLGFPSLVRFCWRLQGL